MKKIFSRFQKRERLLFTATVSLIAAVVLYVMVLEPVYSRWTNLSDELDTADSKLLKNLRLLTQKDSLKSEYDKYKDFIHQTASAEEQVAAAMGQIESFAMASGVKIISMKPTATKKFKAYKRFSVELISEGTIKQFLKFIYDMESSKKLLKVERLVLSLKGGQQDVLKGSLIINKISF